MNITIPSPTKNDCKPLWKKLFNIIDVCSTQQNKFYQCWSRWIFVLKIVCSMTAFRNSRKPSILWWSSLTSATSSLSSLAMETFAVSTVPCYVFSLTLSNSVWMLFWIFADTLSTWGRFAWMLYSTPCRSGGFNWKMTLRKRANLAPF